MNPLQNRFHSFSFYEEILDRIHEGIHVINENGRTVVYNRKMTELESMSKQDVLGKPLLEIFQFPNGQESTLLLALRTGQEYRNIRQTYYNDKGKKITTINHTFPIYEQGKIVGAVEIANDVTKIERFIRGTILEQEKNPTRFTFQDIIGKSDAIREIIENAKRAARTTSSVLVVGETGTGKELFVQSIHHASASTAAPFISQNCAALPDSLIEGLLFGTVRGAFTGAVERPGLFEQAEGGTLFLDEINSLSLHLQAKLLRAIQERMIRRIGDTKDRPIHVRIIAAINEDPVEAISNNHLRKDLFYRLGVVTLFIPPLRQRKEDIPELVQYFIAKYNDLFQMNVKQINQNVLKFLMEYDWPGNVRELQHMVEGAMNLMLDDEGEIQLSHLPIRHSQRISIKNSNQLEQQIFPENSLPENSLAELQQVQPIDHENLTLQAQMKRFETSYIQHVLETCHYNISKAAKELGISRQSLQYRIRKLKLQNPNNPANSGEH
ncbi:sigma 54-interacting transcriptional regulator [Fodinisporobacter ferrooxydans]|uniref:Sigma 54-interacting transcriptional regulator n=1 Tax=Fodinisporobacter ferrooxydans TaxID=2901836 RepID=A0ABY4CNL4_9BACL|nr:sigma 54-interacting transcriptional regulator [Alicyclobacillaceae bacterium MYW30-H2]